ncbi:Ca2+ regulator and membrane fusion protein Fig1-domain-containing protein [Dipodascopsis tothii]|uniref:Ca2+ regulator and membrane fusion protein Fig1-domain-containing protein n=1 Tax=Dipodascopsis tothii TaxID=44089 RepID=UPI0034CF51E7
MISLPPLPKNPVLIARGAVAVMLFVTAFLLCFLVAGATRTGATYADVYVVRLAEDGILVDAGYYGICARSESDQYTNSSLRCAPVYNATLALGDYMSSSMSSDILDLAYSFSNDVIHPGMLLTGLVFVSVTFLCNGYGIAAAIAHGPGASGSRAVRRQAVAEAVAVLGTAAAVVGTAIWGMGVGWAHAAARALARTLADATGSAVTAAVGRRADGMGWAAFAFMLLADAALVFAARAERPAERPVSAGGETASLASDATVVGMKYEAEA